MEPFCRPLGPPGEGGGEVKLGRGESSSTKNECEISFEMQSRLAIINFSFLVSHANRRGSKISRGRPPPSPERTKSNARWTLSLSGVDRFASLEFAIVSRAVDINTVETALPLDAVRERLCVDSCDGGIRGRLIDDLGSGVVDRVPASEAIDRLSRWRGSGLTAEGLIGGVGGTEGMLSDPLRDTVRSESLGGCSGADCVPAGVGSVWCVSPAVGFDSRVSFVFGSSWLTGPFWEGFGSAGEFVVGSGASFAVETSGMVLRA